MASAVLSPILSILGPGLAGLFGNRQPQTQTTDSNTSGSTQAQTNQSGTSTSTSTPNLDPETMGFRNQLMQAYSQMLSKDPDLSGYRAEGLKSISDSTNKGVGNLNNFLASRGIGGTEGAAIGATNILNNGTNAANTFKASIPQLALDNMLKQLQSAGGFFSSIPVGQTTSGSSESSGVSNQQQQQQQNSHTVGSKPDPLGGFITGAAAGGAQYGNQMFQNNLAQQYGRSIATN